MYKLVSTLGVFQMAKIIYFAKKESREIFLFFKIITNGSNIITKPHFGKTKCGFVKK